MLDCCISSASALEMLQSCTEPSIYGYMTCHYWMFMQSQPLCLFLSSWFSLIYCNYVLSVRSQKWHTRCHHSLSLAKAITTWQYIQILAPPKQTQYLLHHTLDFKYIRLDILVIQFVNQNMNWPLCATPLMGHTNIGHHWKPLPTDSIAFANVTQLIVLIDILICN